MRAVGVACPPCHGTGRISASSWLGGGWKCPHCHGTGQTFDWYYIQEPKVDAKEYIADLRKKIEDLQAELAAAEKEMQERCPHPLANLSFTFTPQEYTQYRRQTYHIAVDCSQCRGNTTVRVEQNTGIDITQVYDRGPEA